jgi:hypothetical protein
MFRRLMSGEESKQNIPLCMEKIRRPSWEANCLLRSHKMYENCKIIAMFGRAAPEFFKFSFECYIYA